MRSYERLEFLGDRVLGLVIAAMLLQSFPDEAEGALAQRQAVLVRRESLVRVADVVGLERFLRLAPSETQEAQVRQSLRADALEAVIGALYLDGGLAAAASFIERHWAPLIAEDTYPPRDAKTSLQEWAQARGLPLPLYEEVGRTGPDHAPCFTVRATVDGRPPALAEGPSKRAAEQDAAALLLEAIADHLDD